jgi:hypothetical protein
MSLYKDRWNRGFDVTKSDTVDIPQYASYGLTGAIACSGTGTVIAVWEDQTTSTLQCAAGQVLTIGVRRVNASSTATGIVALYER